MNPKSKEFKALQAKWYKKLSESGFEDIETSSGHLKSTASTHGVYKKERIDRNIAKSEYYRLAGQFLHEHQFRNLRERYIWELHAEGMPCREIIEKLNMQGFRMYKWIVQTTISVIGKEMLKKYGCGTNSTNTD